MIMDQKQRSVDWALAVGLGAGTAAGVGLVLAELAFSVIQGGSGFAPVRLAATLVLDSAALSRLYPLPAAVAVGAGIHWLLASIYGIVALLVLTRAHRVDAHLARLLAAGGSYGALIWATNYLVVSPLVFPQFAAVSLLWPSLVGHVVAFGLVLGGYVAWSRARYN
jgi:hypothetical protein